MSKQRTQTQRVIAAARSYRGITQVDFLLPDVIDGGPPITRLGARLFDAEGYVFERIGKRDRCVVYRLASEPVDAERAIDSSSPIPAEKDAGCSGAPVGGPLSVGVDDGRGEGQATLSPGRLPAAVVNTDTPDALFEVEPPQPQSPYDVEAA